MSNPHEWHIASDREGFFIEDEFGDEVDWLSTFPHWRAQNRETAQMVLASILDNYEPPDPPGFEGGFAPNH